MPNRYENKYIGDRKTERLERKGGKEGGSEGRKIL
jgi:hypothetical protein